MVSALAIQSMRRHAAKCVAALVLALLTLVASHANGQVVFQRVPPQRIRFAEEQLPVQPPPPLPAPPADAISLVEVGVLTAHPIDAALQQIEHQQKSRLDSRTSITALGNLLASLESASNDTAQEAAFEDAITRLSFLAQSDHFATQAASVRALQTVLYGISPADNEVLEKRFEVVVDSLQQLVLSEHVDRLLRRTAIYLLIQRAGVGVTADSPLPKATTIIVTALEQIRDQRGLRTILTDSATKAVSSLSENKAVVSTPPPDGPPNPGAPANPGGTSTDEEFDVSELIPFQPLAAGSAATIGNDLPTVGQGTGTATDRLGVATTRPFDAERDIYSPKRILRGDSRKPSTSDADRRARATGASGASKATGAYGIKFVPAKVE